MFLKKMFSQFSVLFNDPSGNKKAISIINDASLTQKLQKLKKSC